MTPGVVRSATGNKKRSIIGMQKAFDLWAKTAGTSNILSCKSFSVFVSVSVDKNLLLYCVDHACLMAMTRGQ
jgi:hypothetical protein